MPATARPAPWNLLPLPAWRRLRPLCWLAASVAALAGCASTPPGALPPAPPADARFTPASMPISAEEVFALSPAMRQYLAGSLPRPAQQRQPAALVQALNTRGDLRLEYDATITRTAAQAFEARAGNCLSLVIMTAALARAQGLAVTYNLVQAEPAYTREGGLLFTSGHVNLTLGRPLRDAGSRYDLQAFLTVDFLPGEDLLGQKRQPISEAMVLAMFMNNRAAEALAQGRLPEAHAHAREALRHSPGFEPARNTLAVVYLRGGLPAEAEALLRTVLARAPEHRDALDNLRMALLAQGRSDEAAAVAARLAAIEPEPPLRSYDRAMAALHQQDFGAARSLFQREIDRGGCGAPCHHGLAIAWLGLGNPPQAQRALQAARDASGNSQQRAIYAAKLERFNAR
ncbi:tetratricopeptide repeat protein [Aquincola sp. J276]|uniref:tetratricopeptide repeat protein n=1 Tax=Aquincola sp. J276 TaxID=2898432 RepID=UPI0021508D33|nr:tetratricopeptide repeat protein [Aquincola sp. J276]MCR5868452.1 tetratricopeptide repeat protein [Aquincola sp. J276]